MIFFCFYVSFLLEIAAYEDIAPGDGTRRGEGRRQVLSSTSTNSGPESRSSSGRRGGCDSRDQASCNDSVIITTGFALVQIMFRVLIHSRRPSSVLCLLLSLLALSPLEAGSAS